MTRILRPWSRPILPPIRRPQRSLKARPNGVGLFIVADLLRIQDAQEEDPRQLGDVLQGARTVGTPHDVADPLHERRQRLR